ncbi:zinc-binding dehydrogenase [Elusimicrobiota bacterium]
MRAVIFREHGGPEKLEYVTDFPKPEISDDEVLVRIRACALNHLDIWIRQGMPALKVALPHIGGSDISGEIESLGKNVSDWKQGDKVIICPNIACGECDACKSGAENLCKTYAIIGETRTGGYAEFIKVHSKNLLPKPKNLSFEEAASYPLAFMTAWHMLITQAKASRNKSVLVLGPGSGVGIAAIQIAKYAGANPIITVGRSQEKLDKAKSLGAHICILSEDNKNFYRHILKNTSGQGVDIVFEHTGAQTMQDSIKSLKKGGMVVTCGATSGPLTQIDLRYIFFKELKLHGSIMGTFEELKQITGIMAADKLKPVIDRIFPLEKAREAQELMLSRNFFGKIVLTI